MNPDIQDAYGDLVDANTSLGNGDLAGANSSLGEVTEALPNIVGDMGELVSEELKTQVEDSVAAQEQASEVADESSGNSRTGSGEEDPFEDGEFPIE